MDPTAGEEKGKRNWGSEEFEIDASKPVEEVIKEYQQYLVDRTHHHLGYPYNLSYDHTELIPMLQYSINNLGDPFQTSNYGVHSRAFEISVLEFFADLWKIPRDEYWGYVTCCGTEGNLHGMYVARECLPAAICYCSVETHYSILKACGIYRMEATVVDTLVTGEMDYADFERKLLRNKARGFFSAIVNVNCGTTVKGGVDDIDKVIAVLRKHLPDEQFHIHVDGALFGMIIPHLPDSMTPYGDVNFNKHIQSISVSGHKMMGCPMPCGVVLHRKRNIDRISTHIPYLNSVDSTIMGSRNGHASVFLWNTIQKKGLDGFARDARKCIENALYLKKRLSEVPVACMLNTASNTVVFERPGSKDFILRWQLACTGNIAHVVVMPSTGIQKLDEFVKELSELREKEKWESLCICKHCGPNICLVCPSVPSE